MNYRETLEYLYSQLPMFQRVGAPAFKKDLTNTILLDELTGHPHRAYPTIHIAGTNGKGSVTHMIGAILQKAGFRTGVYSSPHLKDFTERIKVDGQQADEAFIVAFVQQHKHKLETIKPSFFEITVAMAFDYFKQKNVDVAVIETGMGGRFDSTNIIDPVMSVITNIGLDHQQFLGQTLAEIAFEKAGIIKPSRPVVIGESNKSYDHVFEQKSIETGSNISFASRELIPYEIGIGPAGILVDYKENGHSKKIEIGSAAEYQVNNAMTSLSAIHTLKSIGWEIPEEAVRWGLKYFAQATNFKGRWDVLQHDPLVIADCAHNAAGLKVALQQLMKLNFENIHFVLGMVKDKDVGETLKLFPPVGKYYFSKPDIPRGLDVNELQSRAGLFGLNGNAYNSVAEAYRAALHHAKTGDVIYIGGSIFVVAEVI